MSHAPPPQWSDEASEAPQQMPGQEQPAQMDPRQLTPGLRLLLAVMSGVDAASEYGATAFKWGWMPFVAWIGMSGAYCASNHPAFGQFRGM